MAKESLEAEVVEEVERLAHMPIVYIAIGLAVVMYAAVMYILSNSQKERNRLIDESRAHKAK
jgi:hypothetical protein